MIILSTTSDLLRVTTSAAIAVDVHATFVDLNGSTVTPGRTNTAISTATTTTVVDSPASSTYRTVKTFTARNKHATTSVDLTVIHTDGTTAVELVKHTIPAGYTLCYDENNGFSVKNNYGSLSMMEVANTISAATNALNLAVLASDVTNNNGTANTIADVTGLSFSVVAGQTFAFRFTIWYTAAATTTGSRWSVNGPASPTRLAYRSQYSLTATSETVNSGLTAYDLPAASSASSTATTTGGNVAIIEGIITPSADGTVIARFASEISASAIVAKAGSLVEWYRVL
jgi:hypothetical protein